MQLARPPFLMNPTFVRGPISFSANLTRSLSPSLALGSGAPTFTRATTATVTDWENVVRSVLSGEARFQGARRVQNFLSNSSYDTWGAGLPTGWTKGVNATVTQVTGWTGTGSAAQFSASVSGNNGTNRLQLANVTATIGHSYRATIQCRRVSGSLGDLRVAWDSVGIFQCVPANASTSWLRYTTPIMTAGSSVTSAFSFYPETSTDSIWEIDDVQLEDVTGQSNQNPAEFVSVGVLSAPYHGANVDGVKYFTTQNGNTVASNVVTEAGGASIASSTLLGYLAEGARTNLCLQSEDFSTTWGTTAGGTVNVNVAVAPDGATTADRINNNGGGATAGVVQDISASGTQTYAVSLFVKNDTTAQSAIAVRTNGGATFIGNVLINWSGASITSLAATTGTSTPANLAFISYSNGWYRVTFTVTDTFTTNIRFEINSDRGNTSKSLFCWGAQLEQAAFASSYIPTTTVAVTRNADSLQFPNSGNIQLSQGSVYAEYTTSTLSNSGGEVLRLLASSGNFLPFRVAATQQATFYGDQNNAQGSYAVNTIVKGGFSWNLTASAQFYNGTKLALAAAVAPGAFTSPIGIGESGIGTLQLFGTIRNVRIYNKQLSDAQLQAMTS